MTPVCGIDLSVQVEHWPLRQRNQISAAASATNPSSADELLGKLAAYRPIETEDVETTRGPCEATITQVVEITDAGEPVDLGERPVFWQVVRRQLATATEEVPWVLGRLALAGRAFRLEAITDSDASTVRRALAKLPSLASIHR